MGLISGKSCFMFVVKLLLNRSDSPEYIFDTEEKMSEQPSMMDVTSDDKLWALLAYVFSPLIPIIIFLMEDKKDRPFIRAHNGQALVVGVINVIISVFLGWLIVPLCLSLLIFVAQIYWGFKAYQGELVEIPVVTDFVKNQGWA